VRARAQRRDANGDARRLIAVGPGSPKTCREGEVRVRLLVYTGELAQSSPRKVRHGAQIELYVWGPSNPITRELKYEASRAHPPRLSPKVDQAAIDARALRNGMAGRGTQVRTVPNVLLVCMALQACTSRRASAASTGVTPACIRRIGGGDPKGK
jgi:hypothetical protein